MVDQSGQEPSSAFPRSAVTALTAPQPRIEQIPHGVTEHVEGVDDNGQAKSRPERQRLFIPDSRVQIGVNQVDEEIEQHHPGGEKQVDSGNHRVVPVLEGIQQETTDPRQVEDVLHDHRAPDQDRQLQADQGDNRDEGIFDGVPDNHDPLPEPLGPGSADIVLPEHLQHHGARHPHGGSRRGRSQNQAGNEEPPEIPQRVLCERNQLQRGRPAPPDGGVDHHHHSQPEVRRGQTDDSQGAPQVVGDGILANRRVDADRQRDHEPDHDWLNFFKEAENWRELPEIINTPKMRQAMAVLERFSEKEANYHLYQARQNAIREEQTRQQLLEEALRDKEEALRDKEEALRDKEEALRRRKRQQLEKKVSEKS